MIISDQQREENFQEYLRLSKDPNYYDVTFDEQSGGISAIHKDHRFDSEIGTFGIKIGQYERLAVDVLRKRGHSVILESELAPNGVKTPDGSLDGVVMDIKAIERNGRWAVKDKLHGAVKQGVEQVVLYFHKKELFSLERIENGWDKFLRDESSQKYPQRINRIICVVEKDLYEWNVPK